MTRTELTQVRDATYRIYLDLPILSPDSPTRLCKTCKHLCQIMCRLNEEKEVICFPDLNGVCGLWEGRK